MKRRLIIIANTGGEENYCSSVIEDRSNYLAFFRSPEGGCWENHEIIAPEVNSWTKEVLAAVMDEQETDSMVNYWLIIFVGHGWENDEGHPYLELYPGATITEDLPVDWLRERVENSCCLLIADCCRCNILLTESMRESNACVRMFSRRASLSYYAKCKLLYNRQLEKLHSGLFVLGTASSFNESAANMPTDEGGLYSYHLIRCANHIIGRHLKESNEDKIIAFSYIHAMAKPFVVRRSGNKQHPELYYERGFQPPFCVIPKKQEKMQEDAFYD